MNLAQTEELHEDIQRYLGLEQLQVNIDFWTVRIQPFSQPHNFIILPQNMMVVCKNRLEEMRSQTGQGRRATAAINDSVKSSITALLSGKSYEQLQELQRSIQAKLASGDPIDVDYWESLLKSLLVWKAKVQSFFIETHSLLILFHQAKLKAVHEIVVRNRLEQLRKRQRDEAMQAQVELLGKAAQENAKQWPAEVQVPASEMMEIVEEAEDTIPYTRDMSPDLADSSRLTYEERQLRVVDPKEDLAALVRDGGHILV